MACQQHGRTHALFSISVAAIVAVASAYVWSALLQAEERAVHRHVAHIAESIRNEFASRMESRNLALARLAERWETRGGIPRDEWNIEARRLITDFPGYQAIEWVDSEYIVRWIMPFAGNEAAQDLDLAFEPRRRHALEEARLTHTSIVTRTIDLVQGGKGFLIYNPVYVHGEFKGFVLAVYRVEALLDTIFEPSTIAPGYAIRVEEGIEGIYQRDIPPADIDYTLAHVSTLEFAGVHWTFSATPTRHAVAELRSPLPAVVLGGGGLVGLCLGLSTYSLLGARARSLELGVANVQLGESEERFRATFHRASIAMTVVDTAGRYMDVNQQFCEFVGYTRDELMQLHFSDILEWDTPLDSWEDLGTPAAAGHALVFRYDQRFRRKDGSYVWGRAGRTILLDDDGLPRQAISVIEDVTELRKAWQVLERCALEDPMLGIGNRRSFEQSAPRIHSLAVREQRSYAVLMIDVDWFKQYNDTYGHVAGDDVLVAIAQALKQTCRDSDEAFRYGGEEFVVVLPAVRMEALQSVCDRMRLAVEDLAIEHATSSHGIVTVSVGCAAPEPEELGAVEWGAVVQEADAALYEAKAQGRNRTVLRLRLAPQPSGHAQNSLGT